jgi:hypothetical protein
MGLGDREECAVLRGRGGKSAKDGRNFFVRRGTHHERTEPPRRVRTRPSFAGDPRRFWRILFFSLRPISMILKSLQIRLQSPERQFCKGRVNACRFQPRDAAFLFGDHLSRFFDMAHDCTEKIIVRRHVGRTKRG